MSPFYLYYFSPELILYFLLRLHLFQELFFAGSCQEVTSILMILVDGSLYCPLVYSEVISHFCIHYIHNYETNDSISDHNIYCQTI
jgi:hypothetical protein